MTFTQTLIGTGAIIALLAVCAFWARVIGCNRGLFGDGPDEDFRAAPASANTSPQRQPAPLRSVPQITDM